MSDYDTIDLFSEQPENGEGIGKILKRWLPRLRMLEARIWALEQTITNHGLSLDVEDKFHSEKDLDVICREIEEADAS